MLCGWMSTRLSSKTLPPCFWTITDSPGIKRSSGVLRRSSRPVMVFCAFVLMSDTIVQTDWSCNTHSGHDRVLEKCNANLSVRLPALHPARTRSEEHTSELQSLRHRVC